MAIKKNLNKNKNKKHKNKKRESKVVMWLHKRSV